MPPLSAAIRPNTSSEAAYRSVPLSSTGSTRWDAGIGGTPGKDTGASPRSFSSPAPLLLEQKEGSPRKTERVAAPVEKKRYPLLNLVHPLLVFIIKQ
jgi:hypothetical protein